MCKQLLDLEQKGMNRPARANGKPRIFCKPEINQGAKHYLELVTYNVDIGDSDTIRKTKSFKSYRLFGLCFKTACSESKQIFPYLLLYNMLLIEVTEFMPPLHFGKNDMRTLCSFTQIWYVKRCCS